MSQFNFPRRHATGNESFSGSALHFTWNWIWKKSNSTSNSSWMLMRSCWRKDSKRVQLPGKRKMLKISSAGAANLARQLIMMLKQRIKRFENTKIFSENKHSTGPIFPAINVLFINFVFQNKHQRLCVMSSLRVSSIISRAPAGV